MDDVFARIGLALQHLLNQSTVNGPAKEEVKRLSDELQRFEGSVSSIIEERLTARLDEIEGRVMAHVNGNFENLATVLEQASISFTPSPAPAPVEETPPVAEEPAPVPEAPEPQPTPTPIESAQSEAAPVMGGEGDDTVGGTAGSDSAPAEAGADPISAAADPSQVVSADAGPDAVS